MLMLAISTKVEEATLLNIAGHILKSEPANIQRAFDLINMLPEERNSWEVRLNLANCLLINKKREQAKKIIGCINACKYIKNMATLGQANLLLSILTKVGKSDLACSLLNSQQLFDRFNQDEVLESKLKLANLLILENKAEQAKSLIADIDFIELVKNIKTAKNFGLICGILTGINSLDKILYVLKFVQSNPKIDQDSLNSYRINILNKLVLQGSKDLAFDFLSNIDIKSVLNSVDVGELAHSYTLLGMFDAAKNAFEIGEQKQLICHDFYTFKAILHRCLWQIDKAIENIIYQMKSEYTLRSLFWYAFLLKTIGKNDEALNNFCKMLEMPLNHYMKSAVLTEIGNIYRSNFQFKNAIKFYEKSKFSSLWAGNWRPYFEQALLLMYFGNYSDAIDILSKGARDKSVNENPCHALKLLIEQRNFNVPITASDLNVLFVTKDALSAKPYFPYAAYVNFIIANLIYDEDNPYDAFRIIKNDICKFQYLEPSQRKLLLSCYKKNRSVKFEEISKFITKGLWPFHKSKCFEQMIIEAMTGKTILQRLNFFPFLCKQ